MTLNPTLLDEEPKTGTLKPAALGTWGVVFLVVSAAAPLSVLAGIGPLAVLIGGVSAPLVYAVAGIVLAVFAIGFLFMARNLKPMGGFYTYIAVGLGRVVGLAAGFLAWVSYNLLQIGLWGLFGVMAQGIPAFGDTIGGTFIAGGIAGALFHRERTGKATEVDVSLLSTAAWAYG